MAFAVFVTFNPRSAFANLPPRFQMYTDGRIASFKTRDEADEWARICRQETGYQKHTYEVREIDEPINGKTE